MLIIFQAAFYMSTNTGSFVMAVKKDRVLEHFPQAICQLYSKGKQLALTNHSRNDTIRGVLTNGCEWIFIILSFNKDGIGASYKASSPVLYSTLCPIQGDVTPQQHWLDVIAGILLEWVRWSTYDYCQSNQLTNWFGRPRKALTILMMMIGLRNVVKPNVL